MFTNLRSNKKVKLLLLGVFAYLFVIACGFTTPGSTPPTDAPEIIRTSAAQTMVAQMTQIAGNASPTPTLLATQPTATVGPSMTPLPTFTSIAPLPTWTPLPTFTPIPPTAVPPPCNLAQFVSDVTVADGTVFTPGSVFVKTWRLKNIGSCAWTTEYDLFFVSGDKMNGATLVDMPKKVNPGETVDISVQLTAPATNGTYLGNWQLRTPGGQTFGIGATGTTSFWVKIVVLAVDTDDVFNFALDGCKATWTSSAGALTCPGLSTDSKGFVQILSAPVLEDGKTDDEPALWVHPQFVTDGYIQVEYPDLQILAGDKFSSRVGCLYNHKNCRVIFTLSYRMENGTVKTLGTWNEAYEGLDVPISIDLSALAGQKVNFILRVDAWGNADDDHAYWLNPQLTGQARTDTLPLP
ncbi:MAG TPA: NBR1-Ig-like domain-containing protein [Anaerolineales bacterium]|nr:NBR1-Ig-like domain-containing protein [Anaerolineales bacterium]